MKKLIVGISFCMIALIISSCGNQNKSSENQPVNESTTQNTDSTTAPATTNVQANQNQNTPQKSEANNGAEINGQQIINNIASKLNDKLNLSEEQFKSLTSALSKKYSEIYGD